MTLSVTTRPSRVGELQVSKTGDSRFEPWVPAPGTAHEGLKSCTEALSPPAWRRPPPSRRAARPRSRRAWHERAPDEAALAGEEAIGGGVLGLATGPRREHDGGLGRGPRSPPGRATVCPRGSAWTPWVHKTSFYVFQPRHGTDTGHPAGATAGIPDSFSSPVGRRRPRRWAEIELSSGSENAVPRATRKRVNGSRSTWPKMPEALVQRRSRCCNSQTESRSASARSSATSAVWSRSPLCTTSRTLETTASA